MDLKRELTLHLLYFFLFEFTLKLPRIFDFSSCFLVCISTSDMLALSSTDTDRMCSFQCNAIPGVFIKPKMRSLYMQSYQIRSDSFSVRSPFTRHEGLLPCDTAPDIASLSMFIAVEVHR